MECVDPEDGRVYLPGNEDTMLEGFRTISHDTTTQVLLVCPWGHEIPLPSEDDLVAAAALAENHLRERHERAWAARKQS